MNAPTLDSERNLAVFIDLENLALGFHHQKRGDFQIQKVLERLLEKGKLIVKKAYADWSRFPTYTKPFHEAAIELIEIPVRALTGKNSADIRMVVDAMDLAWSKPHIDTFAIVSGDSDFSPLVSKLKENGKRVIGIGMRGSTSELLSDNCDEFIYYEDLMRQEGERELAPQMEAELPEALGQMPIGVPLDAAPAAEHDRRLRPSFYCWPTRCHQLKRTSRLVEVPGPRFALVKESCLPLTLTTRSKDEPRQSAC